MYDAALADVSDRNNFIGSVFHDVLYVNSFLTDYSDDNLSDITSMCEEYVCQFLLPRNYHSQGLNLRTFNEYLREEYFSDDSWVNRVRRVKVIFTLKHFITYLTYRSNGAPKKLSQFFENYVTIGKKGMLSDKDNNLIVGNNWRNLYLSIDDYDQYRMGFLTYVANPFMFHINRDIKDYGDKLLVSMAFLVDHLYKYHGKGFSWRNLELTPEIVDINKAPQLRRLIHEIIQYLSENHIQKIISGLYHFKFSKKIVGEFSFLSKISEEESAAFNFTLDESLSIKRHYRKELQRLKDDYKVSKKDTGYGYIHSVGYMHMILGDLHFYDEEYDLALTEYLETLQLLRQSKYLSQLDRGKKVDTNLLVLHIRNELKLGLVFERKKTFDPAFTHYSFISSLVSRLGQMAPDETLGTDLKNLHLSHNQSILESIRLIYQPLLAKLAVIEKSSIAGITPVDIERMEEEFEYLYHNVADENKYFIKGEFNNKVGDILFFKNGLVSKDPLYDSDGDINKDALVYCKTSESLCSNNQHLVSDLLKQGEMTPCKACHYYMKGLEATTSGYLNISKEEKQTKGRFISHLLEGLCRSDYEKRTGAQSNTVFLGLGNSLSDAGNTFLSCASKSETIRPAFWEMLFDCLKVTHVYENEKHQMRLTYYDDFLKVEGELLKIEEAIFYYYLSALHFRRAAEHKEYSYQLVKILYVTRDYFSTRKNSDLTALLPGQNYQVRDNAPEQELLTATEYFLSKFSTFIVTESIQAIYRASKNTHRQEIENYKHIFKEEGIPDFVGHYIDLNLTSQGSEIREITIAFYELKLRLQPYSRANLRISSAHTSAYTVLNSAYIRIIELRYKSRLYERMYKQFQFDVLLEMAYVIQDLYGIQNEIPHWKDAHESKYRKRVQTELIVQIGRSRDGIASELRRTEGAIISVPAERAYLEKRLGLLHELEGFYAPLILLDTVVQDVYKIKKAIENRDEPKHIVDLINDTLMSHIGLFEERNLHDLKRTRAAGISNSEDRAFCKERATLLKIVNNFFDYLKQEVSRWNGSDTDSSLFEKTIIPAMFNDYLPGIFKRHTDVLRIWFTEHLAASQEKIDNWPDDQIKNCFQYPSPPPIQPEAIAEQPDKLLQFLITDAMFCLHTLIVDYRIYGHSYMNTLSLLSTSHARLATWCERYDRYRRLYRVVAKEEWGKNEYIQAIEAKVRRLFNKADQESLRYSYNGEMALLYYRNTRELHSEGKIYKSLIGEMYYLNDDLNDNHYHFSAASERYWLHSGNTLEGIKIWTERLSYSKLYDLDYYAEEKDENV